MMETSCFHEDLYAMRQIYKAGGFGKLVYSEGEYYHFHSHQIGSYKDWRVGCIPLWYPTHSTAYYVGVTDKPFTSVSCTGSNAGFESYQPGANASTAIVFTDQIALFKTAEGGTSRMLMCKGIRSKGRRNGPRVRRAGLDGRPRLPGRHEGTARHHPPAAPAQTSSPAATAVPTGIAVQRVHLCR